MAHEECDCVHGAYGGFSDVPSHEIRDFTLKVQPSLTDRSCRPMHSQVLNDRW